MLIDPVTLDVHRLTLRRRTRAEALRQTLRLLKHLRRISPNVCEEGEPELLDSWRAIFERNEVISEMLQEPALEHHEPSGRAHVAEFVLEMLTGYWSQVVELDREEETEELPSRDLERQAKRLIETIREYGRWGPAWSGNARALWELNFPVIETWLWSEKNQPSREAGAPRKIHGALLRKFLPCFDEVGVPRDRSLRWITSLVNDFFGAETNIKTMRSIALEAERTGTLRQHSNLVSSEEDWLEELGRRRMEMFHRGLDRFAPHTRRRICIDLFGDDLADVLLSPRSED